MGTQIANSIQNGLWIKNQDFIIKNPKPQRDAWNFDIRAKLREFQFVWTSLKDSVEEINPNSSGAKARFLLISEQILATASTSPNDISNDILSELISISGALSQLGRMQFYIDGGESVSEFEKSGDSIVTRIEAVRKNLESNAKSDPGE